MKFICHGLGKNKQFKIGQFVATEDKSIEGFICDYYLREKTGQMEYSVKTKDGFYYSSGEDLLETEVH